MNRRQLKKLAKLVFRLTRREVWIGGQGTRDWPSINEIADVRWFRGDNNYEGTTWTLSPEVELSGHRVRVCVSYNKRMDAQGNVHGHYTRQNLGKWHKVMVFVDGEEKYPGGEYIEKNRWWWPSWSKRIAMLEHRDGGHTGPVDRTDLLITDAKKKLKAVNSTHTPKQLTVSKLDEDPEYQAALEEIASLHRKAQ